jgi:hypothetical protein
MHLDPDLPMSLEVELGAGNAWLYLGDLNLTDLRVEMGAGNALIDLTGDRQQDLNASLSGSVGTMDVRIPRGTGTREDGEGLIGTINAPELTVNGRTPVTLYVAIRSGVGTIHIEEGEP